MYVRKTFRLEVYPSTPVRIIITRFSGSEESRPYRQRIHVQPTAASLKRVNALMNQLLNQNAYGSRQYISAFMHFEAPIEYTYFSVYALEHKS